MRRFGSDSCKKLLGFPIPSLSGRQSIHPDSQGVLQRLWQKQPLPWKKFYKNMDQTEKTAVPNKWNISRFRPENSRQKKCCRLLHRLPLADSVLPHRLHLGAERQSRLYSQNRSAVRLQKNRTIGQRCSLLF